MGRRLDDTHTLRAPLTPLWPSRALVALSRKWHVVGAAAVSRVGVEVLEGVVRHYTCASVAQGQAGGPALPHHCFPLSLCPVACTLTPRAGQAIGDFSGLPG